MRMGDTVWSPTRPTLAPTAARGLCVRGGHRTSLCGWPALLHHARTVF